MVHNFVLFLIWYELKKNKEKNLYAGIDLIETLRKLHGSQHEILIFCNDVPKARENCEKKKLNTKGIYVSSDEQIVMEFATFKAIDPQCGFVATPSKTTKSGSFSKSPSTGSAPKKKKTSIIGTLFFGKK